MFVYLAQNTADGLTVGRATNPQERVNSLNARHERKEKKRSKKRKQLARHGPYWALFCGIGPLTTRQEKLRARKLKAEWTRRTNPTAKTLFALLDKHELLATKRVFCDKPEKLVSLLN